MDYIDLRSDTVTKPTPAMREAMENAPVGDDVYGEDPTVNRLQEMAAERLGKEAGLFVASGTMGNLVALLAQCNRGDEVILGDKAHTFLYEAGGISALGGIHSRQVYNQLDGTMSIKDIEAAIRPDDPHFPITRLISIENTHNRCGGVALSVEYTQAVGELARRHNLALHLDGARLFNAAAILNVPAIDLTKPVDSITFCLSKGLCAPVGSVVCGSKEFIKRAHRIRKMLGGGMRQVGILAAAGIVALDTLTDRLEEDRFRAQQLAAGLETVPGIILDPGTPYTNMVFCELDSSIEAGSTQITAKLSAQGLRVGAVGDRRFRLVTHYWINDHDVEQAVKVFRTVMESNTK